MSVADTARDILTQSEAEARAALVSNAAYTLDIALTLGAETYRGELTVTVERSKVTVSSPRYISAPSVSAISSV